MAQLVDHPANLQDFAEILSNWTKEDALEIEVLERNKSAMDFNVTRCRYAEMYEEMGVRDNHNVRAARYHFEYVPKYPLLLHNLKV